MHSSNNDAGNNHTITFLRTTIMPRSTLVLLTATLVVSVLSLFAGAGDMTPGALLAGDAAHVERGEGLVENPERDGAGKPEAGERDAAALALRELARGHVDEVG